MLPYFNKMNTLLLSLQKWEDHISINSSNITMVLSQETSFDIRTQISIMICLAHGHTMPHMAIPINLKIPTVFDRLHISILEAFSYLFWTLFFSLSMRLSNHLSDSRQSESGVRWFGILPPLSLFSNNILKMLLLRIFLLLKDISV